jgi:hypothetical protein
MTHHHSQNHSQNDPFKLLNDRLYPIYQKHDLEHFVCTNPNAGTFGGFGNFVFTILGVQLMATMLNRLPVMNHPLMLNMFQHPDPRQSWDLIPSNKFMDLKATVKTRPTRCTEVQHVPYAHIQPKYGTNGCFHPYIVHPETAPILNTLLPLHYPVENISYYDQMASQITQWTFSRPQPQWAAIVDEYRRRTFLPCGPNVEKADLAVQFRTWRDVVGEAATFHHVGGLCHETCAKEMALETQKRLNRSICVFITSDNDTSSALLATSLDALSPNNIHAVYGTEENAAHWHSSLLIDSARWGDFDPAVLKHHQELKDWIGRWWRRRR